MSSTDDNFGRFEFFEVLNLVRRVQSCTLETVEIRLESQNPCLRFGTAPGIQGRRSGHRLQRSGPAAARSYLGN